MFETRIIDKIGMPAVTGYVEHHLRQVDTSLLEWVKLLPLNKTNVLGGLCEYPVASDGGFSSGYRIRASINVQLAPPLQFLHWGRVYAPDARRGWRSGETLYVFHDAEEAAVHTLAHEVFHFLTHSGQIRERNTEANANGYADNILHEWRLTRGD